jgi:hypothetical protein
MKRSKKGLVEGKGPNKRARVGGVPITNVLLKSSKVRLQGR